MRDGAIMETPTLWNGRRQPTILGRKEKKHLNLHGL